MVPCAYAPCNEDMCMDADVRYLYDMSNYNDKLVVKKIFDEIKKL